MCSIKTAERQASAVISMLSILCGLISLFAIAVYGEVAGTGQLLFMVWVLCGSLVYPIVSLIKE